MSKYRVIYLAAESITEQSTDSPYAFDHVFSFPTIKSPGDMVIIRSCRTNQSVDAVMYDGFAWKQVI